MQREKSRTENRGLGTFAKTLRWKGYGGEAFVRASSSPHIRDAVRVGRMVLHNFTRALRRTLCRVVVSVLLLPEMNGCATAPSVAALQNVPQDASPTDDVESLVGLNTCQLSQFPYTDTGFELYHGGRLLSVAHLKSHAVGRAGVLVLVAGATPPLFCGTILDLIDLRQQVREGEWLEIKCHRDRIGRTRWGEVVGLADSYDGRARLVRARKAWAVDFEADRFVEIEGDPVSCDTSGVIYGDGWY